MIRLDADMTIPTIRVRSRRPKTRTGCRTCRVRRIKCDEFRPSCQKCSSTGRRCDGYEISAAVASGGATNGVLITPLVAGSPLVRPQTSLPPGMTSDESQGWDFFRSNTACELPGCFQSDLWERLVLQLSHQEPSILHAAIAAGSMHRMYKEKGISTDLSSAKDPYEVFSLRQYVKAIGSLRTRMQNTGDSRTTEVSLMTCLLFICVEMLRGQRGDAITHLQTGLRILSSVPSKDENCRQLVLRHEPETVLDHLIGVFARLDYESTMFGVQSPYLHLIPEQNQGKSSTWVPATFFNIQEARQYLDILSAAVFRFRGDLWEESSASIQDPSPDAASPWKFVIARSLDLSNFPRLLGQLRELQSGLAVWISALTAYKARVRGLSRDGVTRGIILLEVQHFFLFFIMSTCQTTKEMGCDSFNDDFQRIISLASSYLKKTDSENIPRTTRPRHPTFTLESGVFPSLYLTAVKCRDPTIRRQAISMISNTTCQEGMWEGALIARFVEQVADFEEAAGAAAADGSGQVLKSEDIPESARLSDVVLMAQDPPYARLVCARYRHEDSAELCVWEEKFLLSVQQYWGQGQLQSGLLACVV